MNYVISEDMLECFKGSLRLNQKYAREKIEMIEKLGPDYLKEQNAKEIERHREAIKSMDIVLTELEEMVGE